MGICGGGTSDPKDREVQRELDKEHLLANQEMKLLLLGAGGSGKSTLFKQLQYIHGDGFPENKRALFQHQIHEQLVESMKLLISRCEEYWERDPEEYAKYKLYDYDEDDDNAQPDDIREAAETILYMRNNQALNTKTISYLHKLWNNETIQSMYAIRNEICVPDSTEYFYNDFERVTADGYIPNDKDLIMVRYRTTGMTEKTLPIRGRKFKICDVGGQRNERRKWIHFFSHVTGVIFVVSLSCYDELTFEDEENAMGVSLEVFEQQVNSDVFQQTPFILFFNKSDLFVEKIKTVAISAATCFQDYHGPLDDYVGALAYIQEVFNRVNGNKDRSIFMHVTNATNKDQIEKVFNDVQQVIVEEGFKNAGLGMV